VDIQLSTPQTLESLWAVWLVSAAIFVPLTIKAIARFRLRDVRAICVNEDGAAYTLSYVLIIPFYALIMCLMVETPLIMSAKLGTVYSGFAAARSAAVWDSATEWEKAEKRARLAALKSFIPFSSGTQAIGAGGIPNEDERKMLLDFGKSYLAAAGINHKIESVSYLGKKISYAVKHLTVEIAQPETWEDDVTVTVKYEFPFNVPGVGRILGKRTLDGRFVYPLETVVIVANESPQNDEQSLGIGYGTLE
jgi:hypothetical protein